MGQDVPLPSTILSNSPSLPSGVLSPPGPARCLPHFEDASAFAMNWEWLTFAFSVACARLELEFARANSDCKRNLGGLRFRWQCTAGRRDFGGNRQREVLERIARGYMRGYKNVSEMSDACKQHYRAT